MHACAFETFIVYAIAVNFTKMCKTWCQPVNNLCIYGQGRSHKKITKNCILSSESGLIIGC